VYVYVCVYLSVFVSVSTHVLLHGVSMFPVEQSFSLGGCARFLEHYEDTWMMLHFTHFEQVACH